jgi:hypothetical protein
LSSPLVGYKDADLRRYCAEWSQEKQALEELTRTLQQQVEKQHYEIELLNKTKNLFEGQFRVSDFHKSI